MDDQNFSDPKIALEWIQGIENDKAKVRENDLYPRLKKWISQTSTLEVLDVGAGQGVCSDHIDLGNRKYTGLEPSPMLIERARELYPQKNKQFVLGNIYQMPFPDGLFDSAFSVSVWHLLSDLGQASIELSRVLKENGHFLIITANPDAYSFWTAQYTDTSLNGRRLDGKVQRDGKIISHDILYLHTLDEILIALKSSGLKADQIELFRPVTGGQFQYISIQGQKSET